MVFSVKDKPGVFAFDAESKKVRICGVTIFMSFIHDNFLLSNDQAVCLYHEYAKDEPILDFHNHLPPNEIAQNRRFENLAEAWLEADHYKWRAMRANGTPEELVSGNGDPKEKYLAWAATIPHTLGNPLYHWTHLELKRCFGIDCLLNPDTAEDIWEEANRKLAEPSLSARGLIERFHVKALCTTDDPALPTLYHEKIADDPARPCQVFPTFRPDQSWGVHDAENFSDWVGKLQGSSEKDINGFSDYLEALAKRVNHFHSLGCRLSDHALLQCFAQFPSEEKARQIFEETMEGKSANPGDSEMFGSFIILYLCKLYRAKDWTMQIHLGAIRNNSSRLLSSFGPDAGGDSIGDLPQAEKMGLFLNKLQEEDALPRTIFYNINPSDNFTLASMLANFQGEVAGKMQLGSGWWHLDQRDGMVEQLKTVANTGLLSRFVGMLTDSRSFLSFPRHEYFRRILANLMGEWMQDGFIPDDFELVGDMVQRISYQNAKDYLNLPEE